MSTSFDPRSRLIIVRAEVWGMSKSAILSLALDTGATFTVMDRDRLIRLGYDPVAASKKVTITTGSGVEVVPKIQVSKMFTLGQERIDFPVLSLPLPSSAGVDGVLGLDFLRNQCVAIDFRNGQITLD